MSSQHSSAGAVLAVVVETEGAEPVPSLVLELCGPVGAGRAELLAARLAERHQGHRIALDGDGPDRRTLRLAPAALTDDLLADLLAPLAGVTGLVPVTGRQRELLLAAVTGPGGPERQVGQFAWNWDGPLDPARFAAAWQSVADHEVVLRASFDWTGAPRLVLNGDCLLEVAHLPAAAASWNDLLAADRLRGFEPHRPGLLRVTVLAGPAGGPASARVLVTYHRALLDERGVLLLVREFYRAYVAGGVLPGGERRPDLRDHARWLERQNTGPARDFWLGAAPPTDAAVSVGRPGGPTGYSGPGQVRRRLRPPHAARLRSWAALRGVGESSVLHVAWALLLYRAAGTAGPLPVVFGVHLSGWELPMRGAAGIPGLLGNALPMTVTVDPADLLVDLLRQARDTVLDLTGYAWVPSELVQEWTGRPGGGGTGDTLVHFDPGVELPRTLRAELAGQGIRVDAPRGVGGDTVLPITLVARPDDEGGLQLTAAYDRDRLADEDATRTLTQCAGLLRALPEQQSRTATVAEVLRLLDGVELPRVARGRRERRRPTAAELRPGLPQAGVVCLLELPGVPAGVYELLARQDPGPERLVLLSMDAPPRTLPAAVRELVAPGQRLVLGGCGPAAGPAHRIARQAAERTGAATAVVLAGLGDPEECARALARGLAAVRERARPGPPAVRQRRPSRRPADGPGANTG